MIYLNPGDNLQEVLDSVPNNTAHRNPIQITLNPGKYEVSDTLRANSRFIIYGYGAELFCNHNNNALSIGESKEPYHCSIIGLTISGPISYSPSKGIFIDKGNFLSIKDCIILRFDIGIAADGSDPVDISIENTYINGCRLGVHSLGANVIKYDGGKITGDRSRYKDGMAFHIEKTTSAFINNVDCSIHSKCAVLLDGVSGGYLNIYTEDIGVDYKLPNPDTNNNLCVIDVRNTNSLLISGYCNAICAPVGLPYDCKSGIRISNSSGIFINSLINGPKTYEIEVMDDVSDFSYFGSSIYTFNPKYKPRIFKPRTIQKDLTFSNITGSSSVSWNQTDSILSILNNQIQQEAKSLVNEGFVSGEKYRFTCDVEILSESHDPLGSGRLAYRLRLGNGADLVTVDTPVSFGCTSSLRIDWVPKTSGNQFCIYHASRLNPATSKVYGLFTAKLSNMKLVKVSNV